MERQYETYKRIKDLGGINYFNTIHDYLVEV